MGGEIKSKVRRFAKSKGRRCALSQKSRVKSQEWPSGWPAGDIVGWAASPDRPGDSNPRVVVPNSSGCIFVILVISRLQGAAKPPAPPYGRIHQPNMSA